jgi:hypothetical protein
MKCNEVEKFIYLYKPGELSAQELKTLNDHIAVCRNCRESMEEINEEGNILEELKQRSAFTAPSLQFKERILSLINDRTTIDMKIERRPSFIDFRSVFMRPFYRITSAALVAGFVLLFLLQNYFTFNDILKLENKFGNPTIYAKLSMNPDLNLNEEDIRFIKSVYMDQESPAAKTSLVKELSRRNRFLVSSFSKHSQLLDLATHISNPDPFKLYLLYNNVLALKQSAKIK